MPEPITPADLSRELGVDAKRIREYLRSEEGKLVAPETHWLLDETKAAKVLAHFRAKS